MAALRRAQASDTNFKAAFLLDANGQVVASSDPALDGSQDLAGTQIFQQPKAGNQFISDLSIGKIAPVPAIYFSSPVRDAVGTVVGVAGLRTAPDKLFSFFRSDLLGQQGYAMLLDQYGIIIGTSSTQQALYHSLAPLNDTQQATLRQNQNFGGASVPDLGMTDLADRLQGNKASGSTTGFFKPTNQQTVFGFSPAVDRTLADRGGAAGVGLPGAHRPVAQQHHRVHHGRGGDHHRRHLPGGARLRAHRAPVADRLPHGPAQPALLPRHPRPRADPEPAQQPAALADQRRPRPLQDGQRRVRPRQGGRHPARLRQGPQGPGPLHRPAGAVRRRGVPGPAPRHRQGGRRDGGGEDPSRGRPALDPAPGQHAGPQGHGFRRGGDPSRRTRWPPRTWSAAPTRPCTWPRTWGATR